MATKKSKLKKAPAKTTVTPKTATTADPATQPADPSALSIGDLKNLSTILDVASSRGAFRANEMAGVGLMYNNLQAFLAKVAPPAEAPKTDDTQTTGAPTTAPMTGAPTTAPINK